MGHHDPGDHGIGLGDLLAGIGVGILVLDDEGRVTAANPHALEVLGRTGEATVGLRAHDVVHDGVPEPGGCTIDRAVADGVSTEVEGDTFRTAGTSLAVSWLASPLVGRSGLAMVFRDDTARRARAVVDAAERERSRADLRTARRSAADLRWLADMTQQMSGSLDEFEVVRRLGRALAQRLADVVLVDVIAEDGSLQRVGGFTADGSDTEVARLLGRPDITSVAGITAAQSPSLRVALAGRVVRLTAADLTEPGVISETSRAMLTALRAEHVVVVPLLARHNVVGAVALVRRDGRADFDDIDEAVGTDLCHRAALAYDNARLYHAQSTIAMQLQHALLPAVAAQAPLRAAVRYLPSHDRFDVGGDWYDLFQCPDDPDRTVLVVGDVAGHDLAAATRMAAVRNLLRGVVVATDNEVDGVIAAVDENLEALGIDGTASVLVMTVAPGADGGWVLSWSNAGHVPPLVVGPDGEVALLDAVHGPILGTGLRPPRRREHRRVPPGTTLVLYTDGLVETRTDPIDVGLDALTRAAAAAAGLAAGDPERFLDELLAGTHASTEDDGAVLVCHLP